MTDLSLNGHLTCLFSFQGPCSGAGEACWAPVPEPPTASPEFAARCFTQLGPDQPLRRPQPRDLISYIYYKGRRSGQMRSGMFSFCGHTCFNHKLCFISAHRQIGKWATPFDPQLTKEDFFMVDENTKVQRCTINSYSVFFNWMTWCLNCHFSRFQSRWWTWRTLFIPITIKRLTHQSSTCPSTTPTLCCCCCLTTWQHWRRPLTQAMSPNGWNGWNPGLCIVHETWLHILIIVMHFTDQAFS